MKNPNHNKKPTVSDKQEKSLREWKLPPSPASGRRGGFGLCFGFGFRSDSTIKTVEKSIPLPKGFSTFPLFSEHSTRLYQASDGYVHVRTIQVALKPTKLGSNASATVCLRDKRFIRYQDSVLGKVESSLSDGPIYFSYFPSYCIASSDSTAAFNIDAKIGGDESVILMYKFHYVVMKRPGVYDVSRYGADERGETTLYLTDIAGGNRVVSRKIRWDRIGAGEEAAVVGKGASSGAADRTDVDWKETAEAHVLMVDVPGLEIEEVKVEVEDGRVLQISGERREEEEENKGKWHCVERSSGRFLRRMRLPENANMDQLTAAMKSGVLTVTVPKQEVVQNSKAKIITISGALPLEFGRERDHWRALVKK